jgi:hypothetical protein
LASTGTVVSSPCNRSAARETKVGGKLPENRDIEIGLIPQSYFKEQISPVLELERHKTSSCMRVVAASVQQRVLD